MSERKGFAAGRSSIHGHQGKTPQKPSREISPAASVNKSIKGNNNNNEKPDMKISNHEHDTFSPSAPLLTNSCFPSASRRLFSSQKRRKARIIASNIHRPFTALSFLTICSGRLFSFKKKEKNKHGLSSFLAFFSFLSPIAAISFMVPRRLVMTSRIKATALNASVQPSIQPLLRNSWHVRVAG